MSDTGSSHVARALAAERERGAHLGTRVRLLIVVIVGAWTGIENPFPANLYFVPHLVALALLGYGYLWAVRRGEHVGDSPLFWLFPLGDALVLTLAIGLPNPLREWTVPPPMLFTHFSNNIYVYLLLLAALFSYSPRYMAITGIAVAVCWTAAHLIVMALPGTVVWVDDAALEALPVPERVRVLADPWLLDPFGLVKQVIVIALVALGGALFLHRVRGLVAEQARVARERANLSRYFAPGRVAELAADHDLNAARTQPVAVLFADLIGFTGLSERLPPDRLIELLRDLHRQMADAVFRHDGTLEKFTGDGVMATFGTPHPGPADAANAVACAVALADGIEAWNGDRITEERVAIAIGVHHGPVVLGDIGTAEQMEFAVLGDTVNVASRLERLTRQLSAAVAVSEDAVRLAQEQGAAEALLRRFVAAPPQVLRGRDGSIGVHILPSSSQTCRNS